MIMVGRRSVKLRRPPGIVAHLLHFAVYATTRQWGTLSLILGCLCGRLISKVPDPETCFGRFQGFEGPEAYFSNLLRVFTTAAAAQHQQKSDLSVVRALCHTEYDRHRDVPGESITHENSSCQRASKQVPCRTFRTSLDLCCRLRIRIRLCGLRCAHWSRTADRSYLKSQRTVVGMRGGCSITWLHQESTVVCNHADGWRASLCVRTSTGSRRPRQMLQYAPVLTSNFRDPLQQSSGSCSALVRSVHHATHPVDNRRTEKCRKAPHLSPIVS